MTNTVEQITADAKEARRQYKRAWNRANADKVKAAQARYWNRKAAAASTTDQTDEQTESEG